MASRPRAMRLPFGTPADQPNNARERQRQRDEPPRHPICHPHVRCQSAWADSTNRTTSAYVLSSARAVAMADTGLPAFTIPLPGESPGHGQPAQTPRSTLTRRRFPRSAVGHRRARSPALMCALIAHRNLVDFDGLDPVPATRWATLELGPEAGSAHAAPTTRPIDQARFRCRASQHERGGQVLAGEDGSSHRKQGQDARPGGPRYQAPDNGDNGCSQPGMPAISQQASRTPSLPASIATMPAASSAPKAQGPTSLHVRGPSACRPSCGGERTHRHLQGYWARFRC